MPEVPEKLDLRSLDLSEEKRQELLRLFPEIRTEGGRIDFDRLKLTLGETVDVGKERYGMHWPGKADCFKTIQAPSMGTLRPCPEESVNWDTTENLIIEGDNLEVLKLLQKSYLGRVKMIYIDPPYNTGNDFIYPDNYSESLQTYLEYTGQVDAQGRKFGTNTDTDGRFHSKWMNMMYPRLYLSRNLLREDGVIFISIDDHEIHNLRAVMNDVFGEENFVAEIIWKKMDSPSRNSEDRAISEYHEYVLVYARQLSSMGLSKDTKASILDAYPLVLSDGTKARRRQLRKNGKGAKREDRPTMWYELIAPDGSSVWPIAPEGWEGRWVLSKDTWDERTARGLTQWIKRTEGWVPYYIEIAPDEPMVSWSTLWDDVDQNRQAKAQFTDLMGSAIDFQTPKPVSLISKIVGMSSSEGDIILDFFAGSGTTAHAVLDRAAKDGNRKFILVQLPEPTGRADYSTIADITKERVRRVIQKLDSEDATTGGDLFSQEAPPPDRGFRVFKLIDSNFKPWDAGVPHESGALQQQLDLFIDHIKEGRSNQDLLFEILIKRGFPLTTQVETLILAAQEVFGVAGTMMLVCLERELTLELIRAMADLNPECVVFLDEGFAGNDQLKTNAVQIFKTKGVAKFLTV